MALLSTAAFEVAVMRGSNDFATWLQPVVIAAVVAGAVALVVSMVRSDLTRFARPGLALALTAVLLPPAVWSYSVIGERANANLPYVDPGSTETLAFRPGAGPASPERVNQALITYLRDNRGDAKWLAATESSMSASGMIIATGEPVMAMGGFSGSDPAVSTESLARMVDDGTVRFFLLGGLGGPARRGRTPRCR